MCLWAFICELVHKEKNTDAASKTKSQPEQKGFCGFVKYSCGFVRFVVKEYFRVTLLTIKTKRKMKKETWKFVIQTILAILTAIATSFGVTSCMN